MKRFCLFVLSVFSIFLMGANLHHETSVDPKTMQIQFNVGEEKLNINLEAPGLRIEKYADGSLKHLSVPFVNSVWEIEFHPSKESMPKERVSLVQRFVLMHNRYILQGKTQSYDEYGHLMTESSWDEGILHGKSRSFNRYGTVIEELEYDQGFPVNKAVRYYDNGQIASFIDFPKTKQDWEATRYPPLRSSVRNIYSMEYQKPIETKETWYNPQGIVMKEIDYVLYQRGSQFFVQASGSARSFDQEGHLIKELQYSQDLASGKVFFFDYEKGRKREFQQDWLSKKLFKEQQVSGF